MAFKYSLDVVCDLSENHTVSDSWKNLDEAGFRQAIRESLDTCVDENGEPKAPDPEQVRANLGKYCDDKQFVEDEIDRLKKSYEFYVEVMSVCSKPGSHVFRYDKTTTANVVVEEV